MATEEVTIIARRRRFTDEQKQRFLEEVAVTSMAAVARRHGLARSLLQRWKDTATAQARPEPQFVPLLREGHVVHVAPPPAAAAATFVHVDASIVIELSAAAEPTQIAALVAALRS